MRNYIIRRLLLVLLVVVGAYTIVFILIRVVPGDAALLMVVGHEEGGRVDPATLAAVRAKYGMDQPLWRQYLSWAWGALRLDFKNSYWTDKPIRSEIARRAPLSIQLAIMATLITVLIAVPAGVISALRQDTWLDYVVRVISISGLAVPNFWLGILTIMMLVFFFNWIPSFEFANFFENPRLNLSQLMFPALVLGTAQAALTSRMTRSSMLEVMREDYIRTAQAKGLRQQVILTRHALRNAFLPVLTLLGLELGILISGTAIVEIVFNLPGLGRFVVDGIKNRDYPSLQAMVVLIAFVMAMANLLVDILYAWLDPRIRYT